MLKRHRVFWKSKSCGVRLAEFRKAEREREREREKKKKKKKKKKRKNEVNNKQGWKSQNHDFT
jgi:hypothetical protein